jgi:DNA polymerase III subunit epsilon
MEFVAIDVETANADMSSICQVGLALFCKGQLVEEWKTYIDPEDYFDWFNVSIHGIDEDTVKGAPTISDSSGEICRFLDDRISLCHTHFDRVAIQQAFEKYKLRSPRCRWLDSARVARRTWSEFAFRGYGLGNVCAFLGYEFTPHDALEDAKAAVWILNAAIEKTRLDVEGWLKRVEQPIDPSRIGTGHAIKIDGNSEGPLYGEVLAFTGALEIPRREAAEMAARIGCQVDPGVTKRTTILVVGDQDVKKLAGHEKSSKHRKAEQLISKGQAIRILRETDFRELAQLVG